MRGPEDLKRCELCHYGYFDSHVCEQPKPERPKLSYQERLKQTLAISDEYERYKALCKMGFTQQFISNICKAKPDRVKYLLSVKRTAARRPRSLDYKYRFSNFHYEKKPKSVTE